MSAIETVARTREKSAQAVESTMQIAEGKSEKEICDLILAKMSVDTSLYPEGWYSPPPGGASVLIGKDRMGYDSLRKPEYWPRTDTKYFADTPAMIYVSPVDRTSGMIGDFGLTVYRGSDTALQMHLKNGLATILDIAGSALVGMTFSELHAAGLAALSEHGFEHARIATVTQNAGESNFGHTVPWSDGEASPDGLSFNALKEEIRVARRFINAEEAYRIPQTCAFTVESRLVDPARPELPNIFFHVIVTFTKGQMEILTNFDQIFKSAGMEYML